MPTNVDGRVLCLAPLYYPSPLAFGRQSRLRKTRSRSGRQQSGGRSWLFTIMCVFLLYFQPFSISRYVTTQVYTQVCSLDDSMRMIMRWRVFFYMYYVHCRQYCFLNFFFLGRLFVFPPSLDHFFAWPALQDITLLSVSALYIPKRPGYLARAGSCNRLLTGRGRAC